MKDKYIDKYLNAIKSIKSDEDIRIILNQLYEDGFQDGYNEGENYESG